MALQHPAIMMGGLSRLTQQVVGEHQIDLQDLPRSCARRTPEISRGGRVGCFVRTGGILAEATEDARRAPNHLPAAEVQRQNSSSPRRMVTPVAVRRIIALLRLATVLLFGLGSSRTLWTVVGLVAFSKFRCAGLANFPMLCFCTVSGSAVVWCSSSVFLCFSQVCQSILTWRAGTFFFLWTSSSSVVRGSPNFAHSM